MSGTIERDGIERVGVVGCGLMGSGIAEVCARAGLDVLVREVDEATAEAGRGRLVKSLDRGLSSGKLTGTVSVRLSPLRPKSSCPDTCTTT